MTERTYLNFDVSVHPAAAGGYEARVTSEPVGEVGPVSVAIPFSGLEIDNFLLRIGRPRRGLTRSLQSPEGAAVRSFGGALFDAVFRDQLRTALRSSLDAAEGSAAGLRVRLRLTDTPELVDLPWEYLYDRDAHRFVSLSEWTPLVRYLELPGRVRPLAVAPPMRLLVMVASPTDLAGLDVDGEWARLQEGLSGLAGTGRLQVDRVPSGRLADLQRQLRRGEYHVFHYIGHGMYDENAHDGVLAFEDQQGRAQMVSGSDLGTLLHDHRTLRLVVLNSCEGARSGRADPYSGTAQSLVRQGIPAVVAMQFEITDAAAITFAHSLYEAVADGYPLDASVAEARKAVKNEPNPVEWGTPVLYLRAEDARVFEVPARAATGTQTEAPAPEAVAEAVPPVPAAPPEPVETAAPPEPVATKATPDPVETAATAEPVAPESTPEPVAAEATAGAPAPEVAPEQPAAEPERDVGLAAAPPAVVVAATASDAVPAVATSAGDGGGPPATRKAATDLSATDPAAAGSRAEQGASQRTRRRRRWIVVLVVAVAVVVAILGGLYWLGKPTVSTVDVPGNQTWVDTKVACSPGREIDISATGSVTHSPGTTSVGPNGSSDLSLRRFNLPGLGSANHAALVGSLDRNEPFFVVGQERSITCPSAGALFLGINDVGVENNTGKFTATITAW